MRKRFTRANVEIEDTRQYDNMYLDFVNSRRISADFDVARLLYCISPHRYGLNNIWGHNDIAEMLHDNVVSTKNWPKPSVGKGLFVSAYANSQSTADFYAELTTTMEREYSAKMIEEGMMGSYDDIVNKTNLIDITSAYKCKDGSKTDVPDFDFEEKTVKFLRTHNWYSFIPCFGDCTFKINRKRYINTKLLKIDEKSRSMGMIISDYSGDKYDWVLHAKTFVKLSFPIAADGTVNFEFDVPINNTYEELLIAYVEKMKWDDKQKQFWFDLFSLSPIDRYIAVNLTLPADFAETMHKKGYGVQTEDYEDGTFTTLLRDQIQLGFLKNVFGIKSEIICHGASALQPLTDKSANMLTVLYINLSALVNIRLFSEPRVEQENTSSDTRHAYKFGDIMIKSDAFPIVPSSKHITKTVQAKEIIVKTKV